MCQLPLSSRDSKVNMGVSSGGWGRVLKELPEVLRPKERKIGSNQKSNSEVPSK